MATVMANRSVVREGTMATVDTHHPHRRQTDRSDTASSSRPEIIHNLQVRYYLFIDQ